MTDKTTELSSDQHSSHGQQPQPSRRSGAQVVVETLKALGVDTIFGYPGGAVLPIYDELFKSEGIHHILVRHEQAATHAAEGYARSTGRPGVVLVTSGPGATNAVTGLTDALMDSIPMVCITGQVARALIGNDAFQEADTVGITRPCTKHNYLVKHASQLEAVMREAFFVATSGRPGPVVVDIPKDVQVEAESRKTKHVAREHRGYRPASSGDDLKIREAVAALKSAKRPILYVGGGVINAGAEACDRLLTLAEKLKAPVTCTLMGLGAFPARHPLSVGMLGMHGTYEANMAMHGCDVMFALGSRFDDRVTGRLDGFSPNSKKIHVDIDRSQINKNVRVDIPIVGNALDVLGQMIEVWDDVQAPAGDQTDWWSSIQKWQARDCLAYERSAAELMPQHVLKTLDDMLEGRDAIVSTEVGQHQMWAAQYIGFSKPGRWLTSGGLGTMGYGLPAAMGAQVAYPDRLCIDVAGDASIQMNIQELGTLKQYNLPVKVLILNNAYMGMVRQWQDLNYEGRYAHSYSDSLPDFVALAEAYGLKGILIEREDQLEAGLQAMIDSPVATVVDCRVAKLENCYPMVPAGAAHNEILLASDGEAALTRDLSVV